MIRKDVVIAVLATFCLTSTIFMVTTSQSQTESTYNPWADINDDGIIDIFDLVSVAVTFGATAEGETRNVNVTSWEVDCYHRYSMEFVIDKGNALVGNANPVFCYVHVTYQGNPVMNLIFNNFHAATAASPIGAHPSGISFAFMGVTPVDGCYKFECTPFSAPQWAAGTYVFYIGVRNPAPQQHPYIMTY